MAARNFGDTPLGLTSSIQNLEAVLTRKVLKVPRYQRPYTWTEREVRELIQDLWRAFKRGATFYFIGQIVLVKNDHNELEISDGQQRLATLTMIAAYVRDRLPARAQHFQQLIMTDSGRRPRLVLRDDGSSFYRGYVQEPGHMQEMTRLDDIGVDARDLLCLAARTIATELQPMGDRELEAFMGFVAQRATFNVTDADERGGAAAIYNALNTTGLDLSAADNIKCDLLENSRLTSAEADAAAVKWEEQEEELGRASFAKLLNLMPFLLTGAELVSPGDLGAFREQVETSGGVRTFLFDKLPRYADALKDILNAAVDVGPASGDVNRRLRMMMLFDEWRWAPAAIAFLAEHRGHPEKARKFFQALDRFTFACEFSIIDARERAARYAAAARFVGDEKALYGPEALGLTESERYKFIERLNYSSKRDRQRRILVIRLEAAMPGGSILTLHDDVTIEHILPKSGGQAWNEWFPDKVMRDEAAHLLGNMTLVTDRQNKAAKNSAYNVKRNVFFSTPGAPVHALTRDLQNVEDWTLDAIGARQERLVRILCVDWDLVRASGAAAA